MFPDKFNDSLMCASFLKDWKLQIKLAGVNNIPLEKCADEGIVVFNTPGANANAVKELVLAGLLLSARNIPNGLAWTSSLEENIKETVEKGKGQFAGTEIKGKTLGIIGLGSIGVMVANAASDLGPALLPLGHPHPCDRLHVPGDP